MTFQFAVDQLSLATHALIADNLSVNQRLVNALAYLKNIRPDRDLPEHLRPQFLEIMAHLREWPVDPQGSAISSAESYRLSHQIYLFYCQVQTSITT